jgi:phosphatidylglycerol---prolipoprotein diacylglyceryl transferase
MIPWFQFTTIHIGPIPLQVWGFWVALGFIFSTVVMVKRLKPFGVSSEQVLDICMWLLIGGVIGARISHIVLYEPSFFIAHPSELLKIWHGGLSSYGGFVGAAVAFLLYKKKHEVTWLKKLSVGKFLDHFGFAALYGWMIGRIGCFMIHDHLGIPSNFLLAVNKPDGARLDMAFLEILALFPLAIFFFVWKNKKKPSGFFLSILLVYYGLVRFTLDFLRATDIIHADVRYMGLTPAQYLSLCVVVLGGVVFYRTQRMRGIKK